MTELIEINLLAKPRGPRALALSRFKVLSVMTKVPRGAWMAMGGVACGLVIILHLYPMWQVGRSSQLIQRYQQELQPLTSQQAEAKQVAQAIQGLQQRLTMLEEIRSKGRLQWAPLLAALSESLPDGIWLTKLSAGLSGEEDEARERAKDPTFNVSGSVAAFGTDETRLISQFLRALQDNPRFMRQVRQVELLETTRRTIRTVEVTDFTIRCSLAGNP